jgi:hypothetical protein
MVTEVTTALGYYSGAKLDYIKTNIKEIKIVTGTGVIPSISGNIFTVGNDCVEGDIDVILGAYTSHITLMKELDNSKDTVRLAMENIKSAKVMYVIVLLPL